MFSATITEESLVDLRDLFRGYEAFQSGKRQKLSHIDNLLALALAYQRGYGNLVAAVRAGGYIFSVNAVDPMALAKYETANISCACGIDAYLLIYAHIGAPGKYPSQHVRACRQWHSTKRQRPFSILARVRPMATMGIGKLVVSKAWVISASATC